MKEQIFEGFKILISIILGLMLINKINIFSGFNGIPKDKVFDIAVMVYIPLIQISINILMNWFNYKFVSKVSVTLYSPNTEPNLDSNAIVDFKNNDLAEIRICVELNGKYKHFKDIKIIFPSISSLTMQPNKDDSISINDSEECVIDLNEIIGSKRNDTNFKYEYILNFIKDEELKSKREAEFYPEFKNDTYKYEFLKKIFWLSRKFLIRHYNKAKIKWGE